MKIMLIAGALMLAGCTEYPIVCLTSKDVEDFGVKFAKEIDARSKEITGTTLGDLNRLKKECEKSIPRDQECVMVYEFVPVKNGEAK